MSMRALLKPNTTLSVKIIILPVSRVQNLRTISIAQWYSPIVWRMVAEFFKGQCSSSELSSEHAENRKGNNDPDTAHPPKAKAQKQLSTKNVSRKKKCTHNISLQIA